MQDLFKIVLEKEDHWSLIILLLLVVLILLFRSGLFKGLYKRENFKVILNILWGAVGFSAFYVIIVLAKDYIQVQKETHIDDNKTKIELEKIRSSLQQVKDNPDLLSADTNLQKLFRETAKSVFSQSPSVPDVHDDKTIDNNRCWIQTSFGTKLENKPSAMGSSTIARSIPEKVYYVIEVAKDRQFNMKFFKIKLDNGLEGWVKDFNLDMNPKCLE